MTGPPCRMNSRGKKKHPSSSNPPSEHGIKKNQQLPEKDVFIHVPALRSFFWREAGCLSKYIQMLDRVPFSSMWIISIYIIFNKHPKPAIFGSVAALFLLRRRGSALRSGTTERPATLRRLGGRPWPPRGPGSPPDGIGKCHSCAWWYQWISMDILLNTWKHKMIAKPWRFPWMVGTCTVNLS